MFSEQEILNVVSISSFQTFDSLDVAIQAGRSDISAKAAVKAAEENSGVVIEAVEFTDTEAVLHLANQKSITLSAVMNRVEWSISDSPQIASFSAEGVASFLTLRYERSGEQEKWYRERVLKTLVDQKFQRIFSSGDNVFVAATNTPTILFCAMLVKASAGTLPLLSWGNAE